MSNEMKAGTVIQHRYFGPAMPSLNWVPAPRYVLRRDRVLRHLKAMKPCRVLDIGCGPGALISELGALGFEAFGVDRSAKALELGRQLERHSPGMSIRPQLDEKWKGTFDIVMSFEVIEHLQDDVGALREWREYLKPGGKMIISTPAHPSRWNAADEWAGHVRRYEKLQLIKAVESAELNVELVECYGFPLANVMEVIRARAYAKRLVAKRQSAQSTAGLTEESGSDRSVDARFWGLYSGAPSTLAMSFFCQLQRLFLKTQFGNGFIVVAERP
jgi:SAM-dependent methyltransferase